CNVFDGTLSRISTDGYPRDGFMRILEPHTVTVLTTDKCTAECRHCCMNSGPSRASRLSYEQMESALDQLFRQYDIQVVVFAGGEPTLLGDDLLKAIHFC